MSLLDWIRDVGGKLKIVQVNPVSVSTHREPVKIATKSYSLEQLMREIDARDVQALSELPAELSLPFEAIFEAAHVTTPAHGWNVERLRDLLASEPFVSLSGEALTQAVLARLSEEKATTGDLARDVVGRDQAIDAFEEFARAKMQHRNEARNRRLADLRAEAARLDREIRRLEEEAVNDSREWRAWRRKKIDYENMMASSLACLLDRPIVSISPEEE